MSLHPGELARVRSAFQPLFTQTATVLRRTVVRDQTGGFTDTYPSVASYPCSFSRFPIRPLVRENTTQVKSIMEWYFTFPDGSDVRRTDRLVVGTRTFEVLETGARSVNVTLSVICAEIT